jgi:hypothetical protein
MSEANVRDVFDKPVPTLLPSFDEPDFTAKARGGSSGDAGGGCMSVKRIVFIAGTISAKILTLGTI